MLQHHGNCFRSEHLDTSIGIDRITSPMLSYLQPQLTSESMLAICSTSSDELTKSIYHQDDEHEGIFNPASSSRLAYPQAQHHKSPTPFVYGHAPAPSYGFGFGFYEDMSSFAGKTSVEGEGSCLILWFRFDSIAVCVHSYDQANGSEHRCETGKCRSVETFRGDELGNDHHQEWKVKIERERNKLARWTSIEE